MVQNSTLHHFEIQTDKQGHNPAIRCWCSKSHTMDFTWGMRRFVAALNDFLVEHESCVPLEVLKASKTA